MSTRSLRSFVSCSLARFVAGSSILLSLAACGSSSSGVSASGGATSAGGAASSGAGTSSNGGSRAASAGAAGAAVGVGGANMTGMAGGSAAAGAGGAGTSACNQPTITTATACNGQYPMSSILALRNAKASGCFELSHVGLVARTDSPTEPRIYIQDPGGGDSSAILGKCTTSATHACDAAVKAKIPLLYDTMTDGAQISVRGFYQVGSVTGFEEFYIEDIIDECKAVARPAPITLAPADLTRDARVPTKWFRRATVSIPASDPLVMYDFSPPELLLAQPQCPDYAGFAMIQRSAGATAASACAGQVNPPARATADAKETLIGRQFFNQFLFGADCACASGTNLRLVSATASVSGSVLGYLILEQDKGSTTAYQVFEPAADLSFPIN